MNDIIHKHRKIALLITLIIIVSVAITAYLIYYKNKVKLLDRSRFKELTEQIDAFTGSEECKDQESLRGYITAWADENGIKYRVDNSGNIIFNSKSAARKKSMSPSVVCVSYNYETAHNNAKLLASAAMIAATKLNSGRKTVIFVNDEKNSGEGYKGINKKYLSGKSKVIYMDYGESAYLSCSSFGRTISQISIPFKREKVSCDTGVRVHISGINSAEISADSSKHPDPVSVFSQLLTRLKSKSVTFQLADFEIGSNGYMYPVSVDATFVLNSYSVSSFTKYIDKRIKDWEKSYSSSFPDLTFTYEIIDDDAQLPEDAYSSAATGKLTNVLYTLKSGNYSYEASDNIPEGMDEGDIYGMNRIIDLKPSGDTIIIEIMSQASSDENMEKIIGDNMAAASLFKCNYEIVDNSAVFNNTRNSLSRTFRKTFYKINDISGANSVLKENYDNYYTPCSVLASKGKSKDVVHLRLSEKKAAQLTNTVLCYIATKGNFFSL